MSEPSTPLAGYRILLPRAQGRSAPLARILGQLGATAHAVPLISIQESSDPAALDVAVQALAAGEYDWVGFASVNAVTAIVNRADELRLSPAIPTGTGIAAVGPATVAAIRAAELPVRLSPERGGSASVLAEIWPEPTHPGSRVLLPGSQISLPTLADSLGTRGYAVDSVIAYTTQVRAVPSQVLHDLHAGLYQAVLLTSPSTATALAHATNPPRHVLVGCIGPTTAAAAAAAGLSVTFVANAPTDSAMAAGLVDAARSHRKAR